MEKQGFRYRRLVLVPCPFQGHINPMLRLGSILHSRGFSITVVHTQFNSRNTKNHPDFDFHLLLSDDHYSLEINDSDDVSLQLLNFNLNSKAPLQEVLTRIVEEEKQHDKGLPCVIYDGFMCSVEEVSCSLKLLSFILRIASAISWLAYLAHPQLREDGCIPSQGFKSMDLVPGLEPLRFKDLPVYENIKEDTLLQLIAMVRKIGTSSGIIWNSMDFLEQSPLAKLQQQFHLPNFPIGPLQKMAPNSSSSLLEEDHSCITWLDKQTESSVMYVSFGSIAVLDEKELVEMAWGLANSKQPFLWVLRPGSVLHGSTSADLLSDDFKEAVGERGCIVNWAPQEQVLAHRAVGGFFTHCGWNSIIESISEGVPMICQPMFLDQLTNSRYTTHVWRVGIELENGLEREGIEKAVKRLMVEKEGEEMRERVANLKLKAQLCIQKDGSSYKSLNELIELILSL